MVIVEETTQLSERRTQTSSAVFPDDAFQSIRAAVEAVPASVFEDTTKRDEITAFDSGISDELPQYEYDGDATSGHNPSCELWTHLGFKYSVDLYNGDERIAIEVEKTKKKNVSDDLIKF